MADDTRDALDDAIQTMCEVFADDNRSNDDFIAARNAKDAAIDALIAAVRAENAGSDHHAFAYAMRCNVDGTTGEVTCPDGDIRPNADAAYGHYLLTRVTR